MKRTALLLRWIFLSLTLLCGAVNLATAQQMQMQMNSQSAQTAPFRSTQHALQMRQMTMARRKAAAARNTKRRVTAGHRNQVMQRKLTGVAR